MEENEGYIQVSRLLKLLRHKKSKKVETTTEEEERRTRNSCATASKRDPKDLDLIRRRLAYKGKIVIDETTYIVNNYDKKREMVSMKLERLLERFYGDLPPPHLRLEFSNVFGFTITLYEMWGWISETMNREQKKCGYTPWVLCSLIDKFDGYLDTLEQCRRYGCVDISNFSDMLDLRDEVIKCLDGYYRVHKPLRDYNVVNYKLKNIERYCPYDFEYLCGSVISGPYQLACVKYLCVTRVAQMDLTAVRTDIIAAHKAVRLEFLETIRAPMPENPMNASALIVAARVREEHIRANYLRSYNLIAQSHPNERILLFSHNAMEFLELSGDVRKKKRNVMEKMVHCERKDVLAHLIIVAIMSAIEAQLLIVLKTHAFYIDKKLGMYGKHMPKEVLRTMNRLFFNCHMEECNDGSNVPPKYSEWLEDMRDAVRKHVAEVYNYYTHHLEELHKENTKQYDDSYRMCYHINPADFPVEISKRIPAMTRNLQLEQQELERLIWELCLIRVARGPNLDLNPDVKINQLRECLYAFKCDFEIPDGVGEAKKDFLYMLEDSTNGRYIGEELIRMARRVLHEHETVPQPSEIIAAFRQEFNRTLGPQRVDGNTATELADIFADLLNGDIDSSNLRILYAKFKANPGIVARKVARTVVERYMNYLERTHDYFQAIISINHLEDGDNSHPRIVATIREHGSDEEGSSPETNESASVNEEDVHMEMMLSALDVAAGAVFLRAAHNAFLGGDELYHEVPDEIIDMFMDSIISIDMGYFSDPDFEFPGENLPVD